MGLFVVQITDTVAAEMGASLGLAGFAIRPITRSQGAGGQVSLGYQVPLLLEGISISTMTECLSSSRKRL